MRRSGRYETIGPLVRILEPGLLELSAHTLSDTSLDQHFEAFGEYCDTNADWIAVLVNLHPLLVLSATQRRRIAEFKKRMVGHDRRYVAGFASVSPNTLVRGLMTAVYWVQPPVYPHLFVPTREVGLLWLREQLDLRRQTNRAAHRS